VFRRLAAIALALGVVATCAGCSTPKTAAGTLAAGKQQVVQLVLDAAHALPPTSTFTPPTEVGTQRCEKTFAGYVIGSTGAHRAQVPLIVYPPSQSSLTGLFGLLTASWDRAGYRIDDSRVHETRFPQIRAHATDGYDVVATAFAAPFVVKDLGENYSDYVRRARLAGAAPIDAAAWAATPVNRKLASVLVASQIDLYAVSQCLHG
jgi:hypothetical protein